MHISLYAAVVFVKLLRCGFNSSFELNFEIESAQKLETNLNVAFQTAMNLYEGFCKVNEFKFKK